MSETTIEVPARETPVSPDAPEIARGGAAWRDEGKASIGNISGVNRQTSYAIDASHCVTVTAQLETPSSTLAYWMGYGMVDGRQLVSFRIEGGGKGYVRLICRNIRNALKSKIDKHRRQRANAAAKKAK